MDVDLTPTIWGGWIARTPQGHRFRLAAVEATPTEARRKLAVAVEAWERLALHNDGDENPCSTCGHPAPDHYAWSTECARIDGEAPRTAGGS